MTIVEAIVLGLVQGLAEFLPISSSGHLVLVEHLLGINQESIIFEVFVHFATLLAILIYFKKEILSLKFDELKAIVVASIPVAVVGLLFRTQLSDLFNSVTLVSLMLIVTGVFNLITDRRLSLRNRDPRHISSNEIGVLKALIIGIFQSFALLPGISRSGSTILGGVSQNISRKKSFRFSFIMVVPVIIGASALQLIEVVTNDAIVLDFSLLVGGITAFISGFLSLKLFNHIIKTAKLELFGYYCIVVGLLSFAFIAA